MPPVKAQLFEEAIMPEIHVCSASEISDGGRKLISHKDREIGIIRVGEEFFAYQNICPHQGGPVCEGMLIHRVEEVIGEDNTYRGMTFNEDVLHLTCPWHGW